MMRDLKRKYDVIVVGSGPSGATTARWCSKYGFSTLLIDKKEFPRDKPCGGMVSSRALNQLDFSVNEIVKQVYYEARIYRPKGDYFTLESKSALAVGIIRTDFDQLLTEKAVFEGSTLYEGRNIERVRVSPTEVHIHCGKGSEITGEVLVGADGVNSAIARQAGIRRRWGSHETSIACVWESKVDRSTVRELMRNYLEFYIGATEAGYEWIFPKGDYINVGAAVLLKELRSSKILISNLTRKMRKLYGLKISDLKFHLVPVGGIKRRISVDRILLVGDAAGFVDPLIGEGIHHAIRSGKLAAVSIKTAIEENAPKNSSTIYNELCQKTISTDLKYAYSFAKMVYYHPDLVLGIFVSDNKLSQIFTEMLKGNLTYRDFVADVVKRIPISIGKRMAYEIATRSHCNSSS